MGWVGLNKKKNITRYCPFKPLTTAQTCVENHSMFAIIFFLPVKKLHIKFDALFLLVNILKSFSNIAFLKSHICVDA
jgi:hypothetical protein